MPGFTGFVEHELNRIEAAIAEEPQDTARFRQLFTAQQALSWALAPEGFASPLDSIDGRFTSVTSEPKE